MFWSAIKSLGQLTHTHSPWWCFHISSDKLFASTADGERKGKTTKGSFCVNSTNASSMITSKFDEIFRKWSPNICKRAWKISDWVLVHGLMLVENHSSRRNPKGHNRMPKLGVRKEMNTFLTFSWHSHSNHNAQSSVLFYRLCTALYTLIYPENLKFLSLIV